MSTNDETVVEDLFSPAKTDPDTQKQTTRFYGVKFLRGKYPQVHKYTSAYSEPVSFCNPKELFYEVYGPFLCALLMTSVLTAMVGLALALVGHLAQRVNMDDVVEREANDPVIISNAAKHNRRLDYASYAGVVLIAVGGAVLSVVIILPFVCTRKINDEHEYALVATKNDDEIVDVRRSPSKKPTNDAIQRKPDSYVDENFTLFSVLHRHVQPQRKEKYSFKPFASSRSANHSPATLAGFHGSNGSLGTGFHGSNGSLGTGFHGSNGSLGTGFHGSNGSLGTGFHGSNGNLGNSFHGSNGSLGIGFQGPNGSLSMCFQGSNSSLGMSVPSVQVTRKSSSSNGSEQSQRADAADGHGNRSSKGRPRSKSLDLRTSSTNHNHKFASWSNSPTNAPDMLTADRNSDRLMPDRLTPNRIQTRKSSPRNIR